MAALGAIPADALSDFVVVGELDGTIAAIAGALPAAIGANALGKGLICPAESGAEAAWACADVDILAPRSLIALANHFRGTQVLSRLEPSIRANAANLPELAEIKGKEALSARLRSQPPAATIFLRCIILFFHQPSRAVFSTKISAITGNLIASLHFLIAQSRFPGNN